MLIKEKTHEADTVYSEWGNASANMRSITGKFAVSFETAIFCESLHFWNCFGFSFKTADYVKSSYYKPFLNNAMRIPISTIVT